MKTFKAGAFAFVSVALLVLSLGFVAPSAAFATSSNTASQGTMSQHPAASDGVEVFQGTPTDGSSEKSLPWTGGSDAEPEQEAPVAAATSADTASHVADASADHALPTTGITETKQAAAADSTTTASSSHIANRTTPLAQGLSAMNAEAAKESAFADAQQGRTLETVLMIGLVVCMAALAFFAVMLIRRQMSQKVAAENAPTHAVVMVDQPLHADE